MELRLCHKNTWVLANPKHWGLGRVYTCFTGELLAGPCLCYSNSCAAVLSVPGLVPPWFWPWPTDLTFWLNLGPASLLSTCWVITRPCWPWLQSVDRLTCCLLVLLCHRCFVAQTREGIDIFMEENCNYSIAAYQKRCISKL